MIDSREYNTYLSVSFTSSKRSHSPPRTVRIAHVSASESDFLSAPQSVSRVFLETDWGAIFQCKFSPRNMRNTHGSGGKRLSEIPNISNCLIVEELVDQLPSTGSDYHSAILVGS